MKEYKIMRGIERGKVRYEIGDTATADQLKSWGIKHLIAKGAIKEVKANGNG